MSVKVESFSGLSADSLNKILERLRSTKINVLLVGGSGVGKSSTISALFKNYGLDGEAKIGQGTKPETEEISAHDFDNLVIWDTPGLGDSFEKDEVHRRKIVSKLREKDDNGQPLIDLVFLILDGSSRDFSSVFTLIKQVILPNLDSTDRDRLLIGINQADQAMKGYHWNKEKNAPEAKLIDRLDDLVDTVKNRIKDDTGLDVEPIYYSAGCIIDGETLSEPYNLQKLLSFILERLPQKKRAAIAEHINENDENFRSNDGKDNYHKKSEDSIIDSLKLYLKDVASELGYKFKEMITDPDNLKFVVISIVKAFSKKK